MKTMVVFHLPEGAGMLYCDVAELAQSPAVRCVYQFNGKEYEVERMRESLDRDAAGKRKRVSEQLFDLMQAVEPLGADPMAGVAMFARMRHIDDSPETRTAGGIFVPRAAKPASEMLKGAERLILVTLRLLGEVPPVDDNAKAAILQALESLFVF